MTCLGRPHPFKFFKGCFPQTLLGPFLNTLTHILVDLATFKETAGLKISQNSEDKYLRWWVFLLEKSSHSLTKSPVFGFFLLRKFKNTPFH